ncbi:high-affinity iron permease [Actinomortierella ambigua]|uniref:High-affinity iron permease n=1 Tax=Actinomortierella ambigua TaxID=1343610 RepID=A0A9P6QM09_9FUNG|nr:high-affinity iron permease [Actinomortierella ambigua]
MYIFSAPIFFIMFRETTEAAIIVSVLLSFLAQVVADDPVLYRRLRWHVWLGVIFGLVISLIIGGAIIGIWYSLSKDVFQSHEELWEGTFALIASAMITVMGLAMLKSQDLQEKWRTKLSSSMAALEGESTLGRNARKYGLLILPLVTVLREGLEAVVFVGGVTFQEEPQAIPLAAICGILAGALLGFVIYKTGNALTLHRFFVGSTCFLLVIAAGLFAKAIFAYEMDNWNKLTGVDADDAGSYDPRGNVWALSCCNPNDPNAGFWQFMNAIFGWNNIASVGTITGYCMYWVVVILAVFFMRWKRNRGARNARESGDSENIAVADTDVKGIREEKEKQAQGDVLTPIDA